MPKSSTFTCSPRLMRMFFGLRSACTSARNSRSSTSAVKPCACSRNAATSRRDARRVLGRHARRNQLGQVVPVDVLHLDEEVPVGFADRVAPPGRADRRAEQLLQLRADALGRDDVPRVRVVADPISLRATSRPSLVVREVHLAHAAAAEAAVEAVGGERAVGGGPSSRGLARGAGRPPAPGVAVRRRAGPGWTRLSRAVAGRSAASPATAAPPLSPMALPISVASAPGPISIAGARGGRRLCRCGAPGCRAGASPRHGRRRWPRPGCRGARSRGSPRGRRRRPRRRRRSRRRCDVGHVDAAVLDANARRRAVAPSAPAMVKPRSARRSCRRPGRPSSRRSRAERRRRTAASGPSMRHRLADRDGFRYSPGRARSCRRAPRGSSASAIDAASASLVRPTRHVRGARRDCPRASDRWGGAARHRAASAVTASPATGEADERRRPTAWPTRAVPRRVAAPCCAPPLASRTPRPRPRRP